MLGWVRLRGIVLIARDGTLLPGIAAGLLFGLEFLLIYAGLRFTTASRASLFLYTAPFFVALGGRWLLPGERLGPSQWGGLGLCFAGLALAIGAPQANAGAHMLLGDALIIGAGAAWGATTLVIKATRLNRISPEKTLIYQLVGLNPGVGRCRRVVCGAHYGRARRDGALVDALSGRGGRGDVSVLVLADPALLRDSRIGLHNSHAAVRGCRRLPAAGRAVHRGFRAGRGPRHRRTGTCESARAKAVVGIKAWGLRFLAKPPRGRYIGLPKETACQILLPLRGATRPWR